MGGELQFLDIILFALVAAFLVLRLRSVLGRRDGHQPQTHDPFKPTRERASDDEKVVRLPDRSDRPSDRRDSDAEPAFEEASPLESGLTQIRVADPSFEPDEFLSGSRIAFEMILSAFAAGDSQSLRPLLSQEVFQNFAETIHERERAGETMETNLVGIRSAEIVEAYMAGRTAHVTVKFVSEQISVVRDQNDEVVEGDPEQVTEVTDTWTFARDTRSRDPNWILVATGSPE
ncbi:MAG: Tim44 domain-containing protein [Rhodospirillales bacterium]|nr:MAG: Tim44 domain-containing protein [Rhodospirillales bacterium]